MKSEHLAWLIRRHTFEMTHVSGGSHIGGVMSMADFLAVLYAEFIKVDPKNPNDPNRDRFILSKGHTGSGLYATLAEMGFFETKELLTHYANGSRLSGHVSHEVPGVDFSTGSLGHGGSVACGMAYGFKKDNKPNKVYCVLGDGECNEGSVWEMAMFASSFGIDNLCVIIDRNMMAALDFTEKGIKLEPFAKRWEAFGWDVKEINGHDMNAIRDAYKHAFDVIDKPHVIIMDTVKGKGISYMENEILWHYRFPHDGEEYEQGIRDLLKSKPEDLVSPYEKDGSL